MKQIHDYLKERGLKSVHYKKKGKVFFVRCNDTDLAIKKKTRNYSDIYNYLNSRNYSYFPKVLNDYNDDVEVTNMIHDTNYPKEQKITDMINVVALLHSKTAYYKEIDTEFFKQIHDDIEGNINHLKDYYLDIIKSIEKETYMSPSSYFLARNISLIFTSLDDAAAYNEKWYSIAENLKKARFVVVHNNLHLDHFLKDENPYLISWEKAKIDISVFDLYKLYKNHALEYDFGYLLEEYEKKYPLLEYERILLFSLVTLPDKLKWTQEYETCMKFTKEIDLLYKTRNWISSYKEDQK